MAEAETQSKGEQAWNEITDAAEADDAPVEEVCASDVADIDYRTLQNVARSAGVDQSDNPGKDELTERMGEAHIFRGNVGDDEFYQEEDGEVEAIERLEVQTPDGDGEAGATDKTVLYCLTRAETTPRRVEEIREALAEAGYELRSTAGGDKYSIVLPAEEGDEDEESDEEAAESEESDSSTEADGDEGEEEEAAEEPADEDEGDEDDDGLLSRDVVRERFEDKSKEDLYEMAVDEDIDGRSDMTKDELIDALLDAKDEVEDA